MTRAFWTVILLAAAVLAQQTKVTVHSSPVPLAPGGKIPEGMSNELVFLNPETQEVLIAPDSSRAEKLIAFQLRNQAEAEIVCRVSRLDSGGFVYNYTVASSAKSRAPLELWSLLVAEEDPLFSLSVPKPWTFRTESTGMVERTALKHAPLRYIHLTGPAGAELPPGVSLGVVQLRSANLPGYVTAFARSKQERPLTSERLSQFPEPIRSRAAAVAAPEWDSQTAVVLGPRFLPGTETLAIAASFHYAIQRFMNSGELSHDSRFVQAASAALAAYLDGPAVGPFDARRLDFLASAGTSFEKDMAEAMAISLTLGK